MNDLSALAALLLDRAGWTLVHSLWQIALVAIAYAALVRLVRSAAIKVDPEPPKGSRTMPFRFEQSRIASAMRPTGLTVGCSSRSERPLPKEFTPA